MSQINNPPLDPNRHIQLVSMSQTEIYKIFCVFLEDESPFSVHIAKDDTLDDLKDKIKEKKAITLADVEAGYAKTRKLWMSEEMLNLFRGGRGAVVFKNKL